MKLTSKQQKTLQDIYADPVRSNVRWAEIEQLLRSLGAEIQKVGDQECGLYSIGLIRNPRLIKAH